MTLKLSLSVSRPECLLAFTLILFAGAMKFITPTNLYTNVSKHHLHKYRSHKLGKRYPLEFPQIFRQNSFLLKEQKPQYAVNQIVIR